MAVSLTVSKLIGATAVSDVLTGGSSGYDFGVASRGDTNPQQANFFVRHDGTYEIFNFAFNIDSYTGTYGGDYSALTDLGKIQELGDNDFGIQIDFRWNGSPKFGVKTQIKTGVGDSFVDRILIPVDALSYNDGGTEVDASAPVAGTLGPIGDAALGDTAHLTLRFLCPPDETLLGRRQWDSYFSYNFST